MSEVVTLSSAITLSVALSGPVVTLVTADSSITTSAALASPTAPAISLQSAIELEDTEL